MQDLASIIHARIETSNYDHAIIEATTGDWLVAHGSEYSVNQLVVADQLAQKHRMHVISHHQHHAAIGWDRYKFNVVIDNGGLFNEWHMTYVQLDTNKRPRMQKGFTMLRDGYPTLFSVEPLTNWEAWLGVADLSRRGRNSSAAR